MGKNIYEMIKPEKEKKVIVEKSKVDKSVQKQLKKEKKEENKKEKKNNNDGIAIKSEAELKRKLSAGSKDAVIVFSIVASMILICLAIVFYYFFNVTNAKMATYKGGKVTRQEYEIQYKLMASQMKGTKEEIREDLIDNIVVNKILVAKFNEEKMTLSDTNKKLISDFKANKETISSYTSLGIAEEDIINLYTNVVMANQYSEAIQAKVSDANIKAAIIAKDGAKANMNSYVTRHILYAFTDSATGETKDKKTQKAKADAMLARVKKGEDFATLAKANSEDTGSSSDGGKVEMVPDTLFGAAEYVAAMLTLKPGEVYSKVVESSYGYHIIKLDSIKVGGRITDSNVKSNYSYLVVMNMLKDVNVKLNKANIEKVEKGLTTNTTAAE